jgi:vacuolar-type H+-ATPase subunit E/Vma4
MGYQERVAGRYGEGVPQAVDQIVAKENPVGGRGAEEAAGGLRVDNDFSPRGRQTSDYLRRNGATAIWTDTASSV